MKKAIPLLSTLAASLILAAVVNQPAEAAIALDRTRVIFDGTEHAMTVNIHNDNKKLPYLAQTWIEDEAGHKIQSPLVALPPVQRVEPGAQSMIKIQALPGIESKLPQDRETLYYFNVREIPPRSNKPNVLQIALQTRVKFFYRPASLVVKEQSATTPWQEKITLTREGNHYRANNPTPYYITLVSDGDAQIKPVMIAPNASAELSAEAGKLGNHPHFAYINDWGGRPILNFDCIGTRCEVASNKQS